MPLHPQSVALLEMFAQQGAPSIPESSVADARVMSGMLKQMLGDGPAVGDVREITVPVAGGEIGGTVYEPAGTPAGLIVYYHGGGWVLGAPTDFDALYRSLVVASGCRLVAVDYRLAPEHPFPTGVDDAYAALRWSAENLADELPIVVAGDSSGGNFAAVAVRRARDDGGPAVALQVLIYPVTDGDLDTGSYVEHGDSGLLVGRAEMEWFWNHYVPDVESRSHPDASPLRAESLEGLPPAYVLIDEYDPLRDEGRAYAARLEESGVPVTVDYVSDQLHGFFPMVNFLESADAAVERVGAAIGAALQVVAH
jgi:acetyl esterase